MAFINANVFMYLVGAAHPHKFDAQRRLEGLVADRAQLVTDVEALAEILHRYVAVMQMHSIDTVPSFDSRFDRVPGIARMR